MKKTKSAEITNFHHLFLDCFIKQNGHVVLFHLNTLRKKTLLSERV